MDLQISLLNNILVIARLPLKLVKLTEMSSSRPGKPQ